MYFNTFGVWSFCSSSSSKPHSSSSSSSKDKHHSSSSSSKDRHSSDKHKDRHSASSSDKHSSKHGSDKKSSSDKERTAERSDKPKDRPESDKKLKEHEEKKIKTEPAIGMYSPQILTFSLMFHLTCANFARSEVKKEIQDDSWNEEVFDKQKVHVVTHVNIDFVNI